MSYFSVLRNTTHFLKSNLGNHQLAKQISLTTHQFTRTLSCSNNLKSWEKFSSIESNSINIHRTPFRLTKTSKLIPAAGVDLQCRMSSSSSDHVRLWQIERVASAALPILLPACLILENSIVDSLLAVVVVMHTHWGLEAIIVDYARPIVVGTIVPKVLHLLLNLLSAVTLAGLLVLVYNGPGIAKTVKNIWEIGKDESTSHKK